jgi:uncharacterized protein
VSEAPIAVQGPPVRWGMGDAVAGNALSLVLSTIAVGVALGVTGDDTTEGLSLLAQFVLQVPLWLGLLAAVVWSSYLKGRRSLTADFGLHIRPSDVVPGIALGFASQIAIALVTAPFYDLLGIDPDKVSESAREITDRATSAVDVVFLFLIVVIGAPVVEELFYRGLWLRAAERRIGTTGAVIATSVLFGAIHFQPYALVPLVLFGLVLAVLVTRRGTLGLAICAHVGFNLTTVVNLVWIS